VVFVCFGFWLCRSGWDVACFLIGERCGSLSSMCLRVSVSRMKYMLFVCTDRLKTMASSMVIRTLFFVDIQKSWVWRISSFSCGMKFGPLK